MKLPPLCRWKAALALSLVLCTWTSVFAADPPAADPLDWPNWRGPEMNGMSRETGLVSRWSPDGENLLWRKPELATRSTPIVMQGKLYTICRSHPETTQEGEKIVCADAATGEILWENINNVFLTDAPAERVGWSSVVGDPATGHIFSLGICGIFQCIDGKTGKTLWQHSLSEEYGILSTYGGRTNFPTVFEDLVIISGVMTGWGDYAVPAHRFVAFDKSNGQAAWILSTKLRPKDTTYSSPVLTVFNGQAALVFAAGDGSVYAVQPRTGHVIWSYDASMRGINTPPLISGTTVFCAHSEQNVSDTSILGAVFALDGTGTGDVTKTKLLWSVPAIAVGRSGPLLINDRLYVIEDGAAMFVLDAKSGKELGRKKLGTIMMGSSVYGDGKIYVGEATGRVYILEPAEKGVKVLHQTRVEGEEILGSPIISHGRIYLPTNVALYCIGEKDHQPAADPRPDLPKETPRADDMKPAQLLLVPAESLLKPGQRQEFQARLFNARGQYLKTAPAKFSAEGTGAIDERGVFRVPADAGHSAAIVKAEADGLTSQARVRIIPPLPWSFDFTDNQVPVTWIGARYRHIVREFEGNPVLVKITTIPLGTRSQSWMGFPQTSDATIQADLRGGIKDEKLPDMGLINQRYTLDLMGSAQQLQIRSWTPRLELRFAKTVPFEWKHDTWYTMKFRAENKDGKAVLSGKVWPRGEAEPAEWSVTGVDDTPNVNGSPGLFGNAQDAEIFIDNIKVTPNSR